MGKVNIVLWVLAILFAASGISSQAEAKTYYVSKSGSDKNNGVSKNNPFLTIKKAAEVAKNRDVVIVHTGVYADAVEITGKARGTDTLDFRVAPAASVAISGPVSLSSSTYVIFDGFRFTDASDHPVTAQNSYNCKFENCNFSGARQPLLLQDGRLTFDRCELRDFASDGIVVDGSAELFVSNSRISGCTGSAIKVLKNARVALDASSIVENVGDGIRVSVDANSSSGVGGACECTGTSPQVERRQAYDLLATISPTASAHRKAILDARSAIGSSLNSNLWENEWSATDSGGQTVYSKSKEAIELLHAVYTNDSDFFISSPVTPAEAVVILQAINLLLEADKSLASCAITQATCAGGHHKSLEDADTHFDQGVNAILEELYDRATQEFGAAWEFAQDAAKKVSGTGSKPGKSTIINLLPSDWEAVSEPTLTVTSSTLTGNNSGVAMFTAGSFDAERSSFSQNKQWGTRLRGNVALDHCTIDTNGVTGVWLEDGNTSDVHVSNLSVKNNVAYALFAKNCDLEFDSAALSRWSLSGSQVTIGAEGSDLVFNTLTINKGTIAAVSITDCNMKASYAKFADSGYGLYATNSDVTLHNCTMSGNTVGLYAAESKALTVQNTRITGNTEWGATLSGRGKFSNTTISGNGIGGVGLTNSSAADFSLTRTSVTDNNTYGLYCIRSTVTFDAANFNGLTLSGHDYQIYGDDASDLTFAAFPLTGGDKYTVYVANSKLTAKDSTFADSKTVFAGFRSTLVFDGVTVSGGSQYGIANYNGTVTVNNCTLSGNGIGLYSDGGCSAAKSTFTGNSAIGASVLGSAAFSQCLFEKNPKGLQIGNDITGAVKLAASQIKDNTSYGVWCEGCTLTFDATMQADWSVRDNGANFGATGSTLTFSDFTIANGTTYGVVTEKGTLNLIDSTLTANGTGAYIDADSTLVASGTKFAGNTSYGVYVAGNGSFHNCSITGNGSGLYLNNPQATDAMLTGTDISNNASYGLYVNNGALALASQSTEGWSIDGNGYNIAGYQADISLTGASLTDATYCGLYAHYGSLNLQQSTITSRSNGVWGISNDGFTIDRSTISGAGTGSWAVVHLDGALTMRNSVMSGAANGVYSYGPAKSSTIYNSTIANVSAYGVYAYDGDLTLMNTILVGAGGTSGLYRGSNANLIHTHNLVFGFSTAFDNTSADATDLIKEPRFVDAANGDFRLAKGSPAINAGADLTASHTIDLLGNARPSYKVFEIGAYEYTSPDGAFRVVEWKEER
ncbi:MAG TPA: right-handed parallel beta-helix repeat-containing protein [Pirellulaceae bacterium]|nr:right-handed parallel beta-helix repeat-containing protein [Pirellulaceae bacterium]